MVRINNKKCVVISILIIISLYQFYKFYGNPWLSYDEADTFWCSMGLNQYSDALLPHSGLVDLVYNSKMYMVDPGGFNLLLHFWTYISCNIFFLRLLPLLFFLLSVVLIYKICMLKWKDSFLSCSIALMAFLWNVSAFKMCELRPYSMEMAGTLLATYQMMKYAPSLTYRRLLMLSVPMALFCSSRYGFILVAFAISLRILYLLYIENGINMTFAKKVLVYSFPLIISVLTLYCVMMSVQNATVVPLSYMDYLGNYPLLLYLSCFSLLFILNVAIVINKVVKKQNVSELQILSVIVTLVFFVFSLLNKYPWDIYRTLSATILIALSLSFEFVGRLKAGVVLKVLVLYVFVRASNDAINFPGYHGPQEKEYSEFVDYMTTRHGDEKIFVSMIMNPGVRYLYEYGALKNRQKLDNYPEGFYLQKGGQHAQKSDSNNNELISPDKVQASVFFHHESKFPSRFNGKPINGIYNHIDGYDFLYVRE